MRGRFELQGSDEYGGRVMFRGRKKLGVGSEGMRYTHKKGLFLYI